VFWRTRKKKAGQEVSELIQQQRKFDRSEELGEIANGKV